MTQSDTLFIIAMVVVIGCIPFALAAMRKPSSATLQTADKVSSVSTELPCDLAFKTIVRWAQTSHYSVSSIDESTFSICLEEGASMQGYGFFFSVSVSEQPGAGAVVQVGIKRKVFSIGPIAGQMLAGAHDKCVSGIRAALLVSQ